MILEFEIFHESTKPSNAEKSIRRMRKGTNADFEVLSTERHLDKGCVAKCKAQLPRFDTWSEAVFNVLRFAQSFGVGWTVLGDISDELQMTATEFYNGNGVTFSKIFIQRNA